MHPDRRGAFDITFNLPKCASILKEIGSDSRIGDVMTVARETAMREVERQTHVRCPFVKSGNLVWCTFRHPSNRSGDAHSHDHVVLFNLSRDPVKGTWKAIEQRYIDRKQIGEVYRDEMMSGLRQLGYKVKRDGHEYAIVGVPAELKAKFSSRHESIKELEREFEANAKDYRTAKAVAKGMSVENAEKQPGKPMSSRAKGKLSLYGRPEKAADLPLDERRKGWLERMTDGQVGRLKRLVNAAIGEARAAMWKGGMPRYVDALRRSVTQPELAQEREYGRTR